MIRKYSVNDKSSLLKLLIANTPEYFHPTEKEDYDIYLDKEVEDYFVFIENNEILGAGGINYLRNERTARISWDIIHPNHQEKGIGGKLLQHRLELIKKNSLIDIIQVRTSQLAYKFYKKMGFKLLHIEEDYWAKNYHLYQMQITI